MKPHSSHKADILGVKNNSLIIGLLFVSPCFNDLGLAAFISIITTAILLTRRIIPDFNPGFIKGYHIPDNEKELSVYQGGKVLVQFPPGKPMPFLIIKKNVEV